MTSRLLFFAPLVLTTHLFLAQQSNPSRQGAPPQHQDHVHEALNQNRPGQERRAEEREQINDERMDLDELGLPTGEFWLNAEVVAYAGITPDQVHRIADTYLQGTLKLIQLDANLQMEEARLEPMLAAVPMDTNAALAQIERIADDKAAIDKADARLAFGLRAALTPDQLTKLRASNLHGVMQRHEDMDKENLDSNRSAPPQM